ncbi:MAG TPA: tetratricopeptide repeat protein [Terriglobales bacterium]|nr:tetratricopeptide repeat protein [Terriglobales bacterium]
MKRTERHHLKENEMQEGFSWFVDFYEKYKREIAIAGVVVAVAIVVFAALFLIRSHAQAVRSRAVGEVVSLAQELEAKPGNLSRLETLASGGPAARLACLELAGYWAGKGDTAKAESYLGRIPAAPKDDLYYQAEDLKAQLLIKRKEYDRAIAIYQKVREEKPKSYPIDAVLFHLAEAYELKGQTKEAFDLYTTLQSEYAQTYYGYEASTKAARLGLRK